MQTLVASLRDAGVVESASTLYTVLLRLRPPHFTIGRLNLPCIAFLVTEVRSRAQDPGKYEVKADGLHDLLITTEDKLVQFSPESPIFQTFLLVRPWDRDILNLPADFKDDTQSMEGSALPESLLHDTPGGSPEEEEPVDSESALRLIVRLGQPFSAFLLVKRFGADIEEYKRIASDGEIIACVKDP